MVGHKNDERIGIGILAVSLDRSNLFSIGARAAPKQRLNPAHEENLKWRHQRGRASAIQNFVERSLGQVKLKQSEVARVGCDQVLQNGIAAAFTKERLIADQHISRFQLARFELREKAVRLTEGAH